MKNIERKIHQLDATDSTVGRLATKIVGLLRGKNKAEFATAYWMPGDIVEVSNISKLRFTGKKLAQKRIPSLFRLSGGLRTQDSCRGLRQGSGRGLTPRRHADAAADQAPRRHDQEINHQINMAEKKVKTVKAKDTEKKAAAEKKAPLKAKPEAKLVKVAAPEKSLKKEEFLDTPGTTLAETPEENRDEERDWAKNETADFSGKYIKAVGRRKRAVAQVRLYESGKGIVMVNGQRASQYFPGEGLNLITQPLKVTGHGRDFNFSIIARGGGKQGQVEAVRLGISRAILVFDPATKEALKVNGFLTRDPRQVERKKPGLKKARKRPQWSKR